MGLFETEKGKIELLKLENDMFKKVMDERKYPKVSIGILEEIYRRFMKGEIVEYKTSYNTAKSIILDKLKIHFNDFLEKIKNDKIV